MQRILSNNISSFSCLQAESYVREKLRWGRKQLETNTGTAQKGWLAVFNFREFKPTKTKLTAHTVLKFGDSFAIGPFAIYWRVIYDNRITNQVIDQTTP